MGIEIDRIVLRHIRMPLVHFFETSFGRTHERDIILVEACLDSISGWGEVTAGESGPVPFGRYCITTSPPRRMLLSGPLTFVATSGPRGGLEVAVGDLQSRLNNEPASARFAAAFPP